MTETILQEADRLINGDRAKDYGDVAENFNNIAQLWSTYKGREFTAHDVSMMMILVKVARQKNGYHRDSVADIAGYAALDERVHLASLSWAQGGPKAPTVEEWEEVFHEARTWDSIADVPTDVRVRDNDGDIWECESGRWQWLRRGGGIWPEIRGRNSFPGPFTEVLDGGRP